VKGCILRLFLLLLAAGSLQAEQAAPTSASDTIFLWLAGGISGARVQRLAQTQNEGRALSCHVTTLYARALEKAGADSGLIQSLEHQNSAHRQDSKSATEATCTCSTAAAQIASLVHEKNFSALAIDRHFNVETG